MPSRIDEAGHTKAFDYPVAEHWGESQRTKRSLVGFEPTSAHTYESEIQRSTTYATPTPLKACCEYFYFFLYSVMPYNDRKDLLMTN